MNSTALTVLFGLGRMGRVMVSGWSKNNATGRLAAIEPRPCSEAMAMSRSDTIALNPPPEPANQIILAIKPQDFESARADISNWIGPDTLIISIMAGIGTARLAENFAVAGIVRVMPNIAGALGSGVSVWCCRGDVDPASVSGLLTPLGMVEGPVAETQMDAVTALSGCGPAYLFMLAAAMQQAGHELGLDQEMACRLAAGTLYGAAGMLLEPNADANTLVAAVASPGGATEAALHVLKERQMPEIITSAMRAAKERSAALARH